MRALALTVVFVCALGQTNALAEALKPLPADRAAVADCLKLAAANGEKEPARKETIAEKPDAHGRLNEAKRVAAMDPESCIGSVAYPCQQKPGGESTAGMIECYGREWAVWDDRLNRSYQSALKGVAPKLAEAVRETQRAWLRWREQKCRLPAIEHEGGSIAGPLYNNCMMTTTARQAIWLEQR